MAVILDDGSAAGCGDENGVETVLDLACPDIDIGSSEGAGLILAAHMVDECAAAALPGRADDLDPELREQVLGGAVDAGIEDRLGATCENGNAAARRYGGHNRR